MPSVKDFKKTNKNHKHDHKSDAGESTVTNISGKRRPGRDASDEVKVSPKTAKESAAHHEAEHSKEIPNMDQETNETHEAEAKKVEISFFGSEILRAKLPKPFEVAEAVATDWVNDGKFEALKIGHPLAQVAASAGLRKAKEIEKKIIDSGIIEKVAMQALTAGMKATTEINNIRDQVKAKFGKK